MKIAIICEEYHYSPPWDEGFKNLTRTFVHYLKKRGDKCIVISGDDFQKRNSTPVILNKIELFREIEKLVVIKKIIKEEGINALFRFKRATPFFSLKPFLWEHILKVPYFQYITSISNRKRFCRFMVTPKRLLVGGEYLKKFFPGAHVVYPFIEMVSFNTNSKINYGKRKQEKTILFLGAFQQQRGVEYLIESVAQIKTKFGIRLLLAWNGRGTSENKIRSLLKERGIERTSKIVGSTNISELFSKSDIVVIPRVVCSKLEPKMFFPLRIIESLYFQKPMVVSDVYGWSSIIGDCGIAVQPGDVEALKQALFKLITDSRFYESCVNACRKQFQVFHPQKSLRKTYRILHDCNSSTSRDRWS